MSGHVGKALARLLGVYFVYFRGSVTAEPLGRSDWASVTFTGAQHRLRLTLDGPGAAGAAADFLASMGNLDLPIPGHITADIALLADGRSDAGDHAWLELEILTIEE
jgi:hypothetical protein